MEYKEVHLVRIVIHQKKFLLQKHQHTIPVSSV